jgi:LCP family protein required for cell wall assembly
VLSGFFALIAVTCIAVLALYVSSPIDIPETNTVDARALALTLQAGAPQPLRTLAGSPPPEQNAPTATFTATPPRATPTPAGPTATPSATPTPTMRPTVPPPAETLPWPKTLNIVLLGTDRRPGAHNWRTDTIIIVAVDPDTKKVGVIVVPRDLWITLPDYANRINTLDFVGGAQFLKQALQYEFGIPIHYYARLNFDGFVRAVDAVGGITVDVQCSIYETGGELGTVDIPSGIVQMDGMTAMAFARSRLTTSDFDRMRRQQAVLLAFRKKLLSPDMLSRLPDLVDALSKLSETDIPTQTLLSLARLGAEIDLKNVHAFLLDERVVHGVTTNAGASIQLADPQIVKNGLENLWDGQPLTEAIKRPKTSACK